MSRIDEALKLSEGTRGAALPEPDAIDVRHLSPLAQYSFEDPERHIEPPRPAPVIVAPPVVTVAPPVVTQPAARQFMLAADSDLQARLVTGTQSTVSLEQYRRLAAVLHEAQAQNQTKTVMVTSALPHEGKTLTSVNLALTLTESYARRVLIIDADLRAPSLHTVFDIANQRGLSEALEEDIRALPLVAISPRLSVMTAGRPGPAPLAGLSSPRMTEVLAECAKQFDWVLIDTPPVGVLPDAQVLARRVGEVILVIGAGSTPADAIQRAVAELGGCEAISGTVLNRVDERRVADARYYNRYESSRAER